jgi:hypothetical protein
LGYRKDNLDDELPATQETFMSFLCLTQCILLGSFAAILGAHRSEIIEKQGGVEMAGSGDMSDTYEPPYSQS